MAWYDTHKRDLPWRSEGRRDPYKVWVSEIMLQQTRVEAVKSYYTNWMEHFPDIPTLASAKEEDVMRQWQGLGYYSRARNLHTAVREVMETYGGKVPDTREGICKLKGIGEYTAGAILSMAYGKRETAVDGNVLRVFARIYKIEDNILSAKVKKEITALVEARQDALRPGDFNEALMDLGATVCIPGQPRCEVCPLADVCQSKREGKEMEIPLRITNKEVPVEPVTVFVVRTHGNGSTVSVLRKLSEPTGVRQWPMAGQDTADPSICYLLHRRPAKGLLAGMWEFPNCVGEAGSGKAALKGMLAEIGVEIKKVSRPVQQIKHVFSHKIWQMVVCEAVAEETDELPSEWRWVTAEEIADYNLAGPHNKILGMIHQ
ncbi:MAG: A/G-specific adenine glycosylase [Acidaminococcaceae bacterium]|nr:A/G-specific adenine glycosylase [Acidaminococcaceae bacterium]